MIIGIFFYLEYVFYVTTISVTLNNQVHKILLKTFTVSHYTTKPHAANPFHVRVQQYLQESNITVQQPTSNKDLKDKRLVRTTVRQEWNNFRQIHNAFLHKFSRNIQEVSPVMTLTGPDTNNQTRARLLQQYTFASYQKTES